MISPKNKFQCTFRIIGSDKIEISTTCLIQHAEDWNLFLDIFIEQVQSAISTVDSLKSDRSECRQLQNDEGLIPWLVTTRSEGNDQCQDEKFLKKVMTVLELSQVQF